MANNEQDGGAGGRARQLRTPDGFQRAKTKPGSQHLKGDLFLEIGHYLIHIQAKHSYSNQIKYLRFFFFSSRA